MGICFRFKGTRNGGILENASYFVFTRRPDGKFEAIPVEEWHNFKPVATYKNLNDEEAEELFARFVIVHFMIKMMSVCCHRKLELSW